NRLTHAGAQLCTDRGAILQTRPAFTLSRYAGVTGGCAGNAPASVAQMQSQVTCCPPCDMGRWLNATADLAAPSVADGSSPNARRKSRGKWPGLRKPHANAVATTVVVPSGC